MYPIFLELPISCKSFHLLFLNQSITFLEIEIQYQLKIIILHSRNFCLEIEK